MFVAELSIAWVTARAAGVVALVAASLSVMLGLALAGRISPGRGKLGDVRVLHQMLGIATLSAMAVHTIALLVDPWLAPTLGQLLIPFAMTQHAPLWTGAGTLAAYGFLVFGLSGFLRRRLKGNWAWIHRMTAVVWLLSVGHTVGSGSDVGTWWMTALLLLCTVPVAALLAMRLTRRKPRRTSVRSPLGRSPRPDPAQTAPNFSAHSARSTLDTPLSR